MASTRDAVALDGTSSRERNVGRSAAAGLRAGPTRPNDGPTRGAREISNWIRYPPPGSPSPFGSPLDRPAVRQPDLCDPEIIDALHEDFERVQLHGFGEV